jgi:hypothetical protein
MALVDKGAPERERRLQAAVGTFRTCLDVDFIPHMNAWKAAADNKVDQAIYTTPPVSAAPDSSKSRLSFSIPKQSGMLFTHVGIFS